MSLSRFRHIERAMGMMFKTVGLKPRGRVSHFATRLAWCLLRWRQRRFSAQLTALTPTALNGGIESLPAR
jgi:hypothetical protein